MQHRLQNRNQMALADGFRAAQHFPLRHRIDRVEMIHARLAVVLPLMHGVHANIAGLPFRFRLAAFSDRDLASLRVLNPYSNLAVRRRLPQIVNVRRRDARQPLERRVVEHAPGALAEMPRRGTRRILVCRIYLRQRGDVGGSIAPVETGGAVPAFSRFAASWSSAESAASSAPGSTP